MLVWLNAALAQAVVAVQAKGDQLVLGKGGTEHRYTLPGSLEVDMVSATVLDVQTKAGITFILLDVSGPSRRGKPDGFCGAGSESALVWLKLRSWKLYEVRPVTYASCLYSIEPVSRGWDKNLFTLKSNNFYSNKLKTLTYARARPEASIVVLETPLKP